MAFKAAGSEQTDPTTLVPDLPGYGVVALFENVVPATTTVRLNGPNGVLAIPRIAPDSYYQEAYFANETFLHNALPDGAYTMAVSGGGPASNTPFTLSTGTLPRPPLITNYAALQSWPGGSFNVAWQPIASGTRDDLVELTISRADGTEIYSSPGFGEPGGLNGTSTNLTIPALNAAPGETLYGNLLFIQFTFTVANGGETIVAVGRGVNLRFPIVRCRCAQRSRSSRAPRRSPPAAPSPSPSAPRGPA